MSVTWAQLETAMVAAVKLGAPGLVVLWESQTATRPALPYVSLSHDGDRRVAAIPEIIVEDNPSGHAGDPFANPPLVGTEILLTRRNFSEFHLRVQIFTPEVIGVSAAPARAVALRDAFDLSTLRDELEAVGLVLVSLAPVQNLTGLVETKFEGRAALDMLMRYTGGASEAATTIGSATITPGFNGTPGAPYTVP